MFLHRFAGRSFWRLAELIVGETERDDREIASRLAMPNRNTRLARINHGATPCPRERGVLGRIPQQNIPNVGERRRTHIKFASTLRFPGTMTQGDSKHSLPQHKPPTTTLLSFRLLPDNMTGLILAIGHRQRLKEQILWRLEWVP